MSRPITGKLIVFRICSKGKSRCSRRRNHWLRWCQLSVKGRKAVRERRASASPHSADECWGESQRLRWAMCGRLRAVKGLSTSQRWSEQPCVRPIGAAHRPLAIMPSADRVPVKSSDSSMLWPMWVVPITGSTGSALRAVRPFQPSHRVFDAISFLVASPQRASARGSL